MARAKCAGKPCILADAARPQVLGAGLLSVFAGSVSALASDGLLSGLAAPSPARLRFLSPSFLKSGSYQPPPDRRKLGAVSWRLTADAPQSGQASGSGSESFCRRSKLWPQAAQTKA